MMNRHPNPLNDRIVSRLRTFADWVLLLGAAAVVTGCVSVLPTTTTKNQGKWGSYAEARLAYDSILDGKTRTAELKALGFNPDEMPNMRVLNYVDVVNQFGSAFRLQDLPDGVKACVTARERCTGYVLELRQVKAKREGSIPADLFGFKKNTHTTGWAFQAMVILVDEVVVYKLWSGTPKIEGYERTVNPLGPMQSMTSLVPKPGF